VLSVRARGGVIIVIAHRPSAIAGVDLLLVMRDGRQQTVGPKDQVLAKLVKPAPASVPAPIKAVPNA
jgi:ABC-type protease/lipase transport system fused ATPase/permease subunit